jgi:hypothetical protein
MSYDEAFDEDDDNEPCESPFHQRLTGGFRGYLTRDQDNKIVWKSRIGHIVITLIAFLFCEVSEQPVQHIREGSRATGLSRLASVRITVVPGATST